MLYALSRPEHYHDNLKMIFHTSEYIREIEKTRAVYKFLLNFQLFSNSSQCWAVYESTIQSFGS